MKRTRSQAGVVLATTLFLLALLTIIGVAAVQMGTTHNRLVGNLQAQKEAEMAIQMAVENFISVPPTHADSFNNPTVPPLEYRTVNGRTFAVTISQPRCVGYDESTCSGRTCAYFWEFRAVARDTVSGACLAYRWGVSALTLILGGCNPVGTDPALSNAACP